MYGGGRALHKIFFCPLRTLLFTYVVFYYWAVGMLIEVCTGEKSHQHRQFFLFLAAAAAQSNYQHRRRQNLKNYGEFQFVVPKYIRKCNYIIFPSYQ